MPVTLATADDLTRLVELLGMLFAQEEEFAPDAARQRAGLEAIIASAEIGTILVLREGGEIIGMVSLLYTVSTFLGGRVALLEDMIVVPDRRGKGHGTALLQAAIRHATETGCRRITLLADGANAEAQAFYRRLGFIASPMRPYRLQLPVNATSTS